MTINNMIIPVSLRKLEDELAYGEHKRTSQSIPLNEEPALRSWKHWNLIDNRFPYSGVFQVHHMLVPKRAVPKKDLSAMEKAELELIIDELSDDYDCHMTNFIKKQSNRGHFHIHMLIYKDDREELAL